MMIICEVLRKWTPSVALGVLVSRFLAFIFIFCLQNLGICRDEIRHIPTQVAGICRDEIRHFTLGKTADFVGMDLLQAVYALLACPRVLPLLPNTYP